MKIEISEDGRSPSAPAPQVRVTNQNEFDICDMHDGIEYVFPGKTYERSDTEKKNAIYSPVTVPPDVAAHIFSYGVFGNMEPKKQLNAMFDHMAKRFGWNTGEIAKEGKGREIFRNIDIRPVMFRIVEDTPAEDEGAARRGKTA